LNTLVDLSKPLDEGVAVTSGWRHHHEGCPICGRGESDNLLTAPDRYHLRKQLYRLERCASCGIVWLVSPPKPEEMAIHYSEDYHSAIGAAGEESAHRRWARQRKMISKLAGKGVLLDIGCSSGGFLSTMKGGRWKLYGIEMEESMARKARAASGAEVFVGDVLEAPYPDMAFDAITCFDVLEHVYSPRQFLMRVHEWLKPGGIFYAMMPNIDSWEAQLFGTCWYGLELPRHLFHFSQNSLRSLMADLRFEEVVVSTPRITYLEPSVDYALAGFLGKLGFSPLPLAKQKRRTLLRRSLAKILHLAIGAPFAQIASLAGTGPSIEAVFRKPH
jgi:SAM-dependent methyltransferase